MRHALHQDPSGRQGDGRAVAVRPVSRGRITTGASETEQDDEGSSIGQADLQEVQGHPPRRASCACCARTRATSSGRARGRATWHVSQASICRATSGWRSRSPTSTASAAARRARSARGAGRPRRARRDDLTDDEVLAHPPGDRRELQGRGRSAARGRAEHQAATSTSAAIAACATGGTCRCAASARTPTRAPARARGKTIAGKKPAPSKG